ncbi:MAG: (deoxy)nucleoside triphosphate pyrophosphohydrolase [Candidatus Omnitrophica bacterium]|nr:(deoxy)nucleoside triphosphate pyrophosphohydrolase [Candidatus Omnitrophota bacterium]
MKHVFDVVGAVIEKEGKILVCQRKDDDQFGSQWEFPGGKVEENEDRVDALKRELKEEIRVEVEVGSLIDIFEDEIPTMKIYVYLYRCSIVKGTPSCIECQNIKWATIVEINTLDLAPADRKIADYLLKKSDTP